MNISSLLRWSFPKVDKTILNLTALVLALLATTAHSYAAPVQTLTEIDGVTNGGTNGDVTIETQSNLLNTAALTSSGFVPFDNGPGISSISVLNDGSLGSNGVNAGDTAADISGSAWTLNVALAAKSNITSINVISGWNADAINFGYTFSYSKDGGLSYNLVGTYVAQETGVTGNNNYGAVSLESTLPGLNLTGVTNLQFTFNPTDSTSTFFNEGIMTNYDGAIREVEAFGTTATPEPSTITLLLGAAGVLLFVMRRQRALKI